MSQHNPKFSFFYVPLVATILVGCDNNAAPDKGPAPSGPVQVSVAQVRHVNLDRTVEVVGSLYADEDVTVSAKVGGRLKRVTADLGDSIAPGQLLAEIEPIDYELEVARRQVAVSEALSKLGLAQMPDETFDVNTTPDVQRAQLQTTNALARLERARKLYNQTPPLMSEQEFADLQTAYEVAVRELHVVRLQAQTLLMAAKSRASELALANEQLQNTRIVAPEIANDRRFAVARRLVSLGEYVTPGTHAFRLVLNDKIKFRGSLPERYAQQVKTGQPIALKLAGLDQPVNGVVSRINPTIDIATRAFEIEAAIDNASGHLKPGAFARGVIVVGKDENVPTVPRNALVSFAGIDKVFTVSGDQAVEHLVDIAKPSHSPTDAQSNNWVAITSGLENVKEVIVTGNDRIANATKVKSTPATQPVAD